MKSLLFIKIIFRRYPSLFMVNLLLIILVSLMEAAAIFTLVPVMDLLLRSDLQGASLVTRKAVNFMHYFGIPAGIMSFIAVFLVFNVLVGLLMVLVNYVSLKTKYAVCKDIIVGTFEDFFFTRWQFFSSSKQGTLFNTFTNEIRVAGDTFGALMTFFNNLVHLILYLAVPFYLSWRVTLITLAASLLLALPFTLLGKLNYRLGRLNTSTANHMISIIYESLNMAKVILGFGKQRECIKALSRSYSDHADVSVKSQILSLSIPIMYYPLGLLLIFISLIVANRFAMPLSETAALLYSFLRIVPLLGQLPALKNSLENFAPSYEQIENLRNYAKEMRQKSGDRVFDGFKKEIIFKDLSFAFPGHAPVLSNINIRIPKGKMVALVGKSGVGKSTLIDILMGFNEPVSGQVIIDGVPLGDFDINSYRSKIGYVPQDSVLFNLSVRDNLLWARKDANEEAIKRACKQANAEEFIESFPGGYDTLVGDRGVRLSGGQIQRVALARAILRNPDILILDEATSSLDSHSEYLIQQAIENIAKETTVVIIAHRLSTIANADYIYVLKDGMVIEKGEYAELIRMEGCFNQMVQQQVI